MNRQNHFLRSAGPASWPVAWRKPLVRTFSPLLLGDGSHKKFSSPIVIRRRGSIGPQSPPFFKVHLCYRPMATVFGNVIFKNKPFPPSILNPQRPVLFCSTCFKNYHLYSACVCIVALTKMWAPQAPGPVSFSLKTVPQLLRSKYSTNICWMNELNVPWILWKSIHRDLPHSFQWHFTIL